MLSEPVVEASLLTGPEGSALVLVNHTYKPIPKLKIGLASIVPFRGVLSTEGASVTVTRTTAGVELQMPLEWTDIVLLEKQPFDGVVIEVTGRTAEGKPCPLREAFGNQKWQREWFQTNVDQLRMQIHSLHRQLRRHRRQSRQHRLVRRRGLAAILADRFTGRRTAISGRRSRRFTFHFRQRWFSRILGDSRRSLAIAAFPAARSSPSPCTVAQGTWTS